MRILSFRTKAYPPDGGVLVNLSDIPMETFDSAEDFEMHEPEEWVELCSQNSSRPQACVLHYVARVWTMLPCWVLGYEAQAAGFAQNVVQMMQRSGGRGKGSLRRSDE